jgi:putative ABC transport system permease protein
MWILSMIGVFLIATACVNFINLATAQALRRSKEVGVRKVLGGIRKQVFWQFIFETGMIASTGVAIASVTAYSLAPFINTFLGTNITIDFLSDWQLISFVFALTAVVTFLAGYYPGIVLAAFQPVAALKGALSQQHLGGLNTRRVLIVVQFTISQILIIGMIVIMNQMRFARQSDLGFDRDAIVMVQLGLDTTHTAASSIKNEIARIPGVEKITLCFAAPSSEHEWGNSIRIDNSQEEVNFRTSIKSADADYVSTFDLELVAGRNLVPSDTVREMLVNETMVRKMDIGTPEEAIGHIIVANGGSMRAPIVGVLKDFHDKSLHGEISPVLITTSNEDYLNYAVKINLANSKTILSEIEKLWLQHHPEQLFQYTFLDESIARFYASEETTLKMIQVFCLLALIIGCLGLYGLVSFMSSQRTKEIGIRKILGSGMGNIAWLFGKEFARLILIAFCVAAPLGWWLMNIWLQQFEYKVEVDLLTFVLSIACSVVIALITVSSQVIKAATANPANSLRIN